MKLLRRPICRNAPVPLLDDHVSEVGVEMAAVDGIVVSAVHIVLGRDSRHQYIAVIPIAEWDTIVRHAELAAGEAARKMVANQQSPDAR